MPDKFENLLFQALLSDHGIAASTTNPEQLRQKLYAARRGDPSLSHIAFLIVNESELWIIPKQEQPDATHPQDGDN